MICEHWEKNLKIRSSESQITGLKKKVHIFAEFQLYCIVLEISTL